MKKIILISLLISSKAFAYKCQVNLPLHYEIQKNPLKAVNFFIGTFAKGTGELGVINIEKSLNLNATTLPILLRGECLIEGILFGPKYLIVSTRELNDFNGEVLTRGSILYYELKDSKDSIDKIAAKNGVVGKLNFAWQFCQEDKECLKLKDHCGNSIGVNQKYQTNVLDFYKTQDRVGCGRSSDKSTTSKCIDNFCS